MRTCLLKFRDSMLELKNVRAITQMAMLMALSLILNLFASIQITESLKLSFGFLATAMMGMLFGPSLAGIGAALSDIIYALITGYGMSFVMDFIERPTTIHYLKLLGSILLFCFGAYTYYCKPAEPHKASGRRGTLWHNMFTGFAITVSNPLIIVLFLALFARFGFVVPEHPAEQAFGYAGVMTGAVVWWFSLTTALNRIGSRFEMGTITLLNRLLGLLVMAASVVGLFYTLFR